MFLSHKIGRLMADSLNTKIEAIITAESTDIHVNASIKQIRKTKWTEKIAQELGFKNTGVKNKFKYAYRPLK